MQPGSFAWSCLQQHPRLIVHEELFHFVEAERAMRHAISAGGANIYFDARRGDAIEFLRNYVFSPQDAAIGGVGLKIFAEYVICSGTDNLFGRLRSAFENLHVIHVVRRNYLDVLVSRALATLSGQWEDRIAAPAPHRPYGEIRFSLDVDIARRFFDNMARADRYFEQRFAGGRYLQLDYEALSARTGEAIAGVFGFLGQKNAAFEIALNKQKTAQNVSIVSNYRQLKAAFAGTDFARFFNDSAPARTPAGAQRRPPLKAPEKIVPKLSI